MREHRAARDPCARHGEPADACRELPGTRHLPPIPAPAVWRAVLLIGPPAVFYAGAFLEGAPLVPAVDSFGAFLGLLAPMAVRGPVEAFGRRGVALRRLHRRMAPARAVIATPLFTAARGSDLLAISFHRPVTEPASPAPPPWCSGSVAPRCS